MKKQSIQFGKSRADSYGFGTLEELIATPWFQTRPDFIQEMILDYPPITLYTLKKCKTAVYIYSYCEDKTLTVIHVGGHTRVNNIKPAKDLIMLSQKESDRILKLLKLR